MDCKLLVPISTEFHSIFQNAMNELFVNACLCEEATLYFFVIEICENSECVYLVSKDGTIESITLDEKQTTKETIYSYLEEKKVGKKYRLLKRSGIFEGDSEFRVGWVFSSASIDLNRGRFLFHCVCESLDQLFISLLNKVDFAHQMEEIEQCASEWSVYTNYFVQQSVQNAVAKTCQYLHELYAPLNIPLIVRLSGEYYERSECQSNMVLLFSDAVSNMKEADFVYCLDDIQSDQIEGNGIEFIPQKIRLIRKLLQIAQQDLCLVLGEDVERQTFKVLGICKEEFFQDKKQHFPYVKVKFRNHMHWDLLENEVYIFSYRYGQYKIDNEIHKEVLIRKLQEYFGECEDYGDAAESIMSALQQEHGTMIIIMNSADAGNQVKRLGEKEYGLLNVDSRIQKENIQQLSNIDGSVIMDTSGRIYGIGMILDGSVGLEKGNLARGARYNSAVKYSEYLKVRDIKAMSFIISEDRTLDIVYS